MSTQFSLVETKIVAKEEQYTYKSGDIVVTFRAGKKPWTWIASSTPNAKEYVNPLIEAYVEAGMSSSRKGLTFGEAIATLTIG
jgi:hypothetical protein